MSASTASSAATTAGILNTGSRCTDRIRRTFLALRCLPVAGQARRRNKKEGLRPPEPRLTRRSRGIHAVGHVPNPSAHRRSQRRLDRLPPVRGDPASTAATLAGPTAETTHRAILTLMPSPTAPRAGAARALLRLTRSRRSDGNLVPYGHKRAVVVPSWHRCVAMRHVSTRAVFAHWSERRGNRPAPERREIDPSAIRHALGDTFILAADLMAELRFRLAGTRLCALFCRELKGESFGSLWNGPSESPVRHLVAVVCRENVGAVASVG